MGKMFYITGSGLKRVVYTTKSGARYIRTKSGKRYLSLKQIKDSHKRKSSVKKPHKKRATTKKRVTTKKRTTTKKKPGFFSLWGG